MTEGLGAGGLLLLVLPRPHIVRDVAGEGAQLVHELTALLFVQMGLAAEQIARDRGQVLQGNALVGARLLAFDRLLDVLEELRGKLDVCHGAAS
jgi:hypothetical protein